MIQKFRAFSCRRVTSPVIVVVLVRLPAIMAVTTARPRRHPGLCCLRGTCGSGGSGAGNDGSGSGGYRETIGRG